MASVQDLAKELLTKCLEALPAGTGVCSLSLHHQPRLLGLPKDSAPCVVISRIVDGCAPLIVSLPIPGYSTNQTGPKVKAMTHNSIHDYVPLCLSSL
jgi:hypothetical protein